MDVDGVGACTPGVDPAAADPPDEAPDEARGYGPLPAAPAPALGARARGGRAERGKGSPREGLGEKCGGGG